jgi:hypothetical protein
VSTAVDLERGTAFVVSDLHGEWEPYACYRDRFLELYAQGRADVLIFLGDLIHHYGPAEDDASVDILLDIMRMRHVLGPWTVMALLGNHELTHIYAVPLSKGDVQFTPRFEHALGSNRAAVMRFLKSLPFLIRTPGGVMLTHAGAAPLTATSEAASRLLAFSHDALLDEVDRLLSRRDVGDLVALTQQATGLDYDQSCWEFLAVTGPEDPRYLDLVRGMIASNLEPEWPLLWDFFFTRCEEGLGEQVYGSVLARFLEAYSRPQQPQRVLLTGHIAARGGHKVVAGKQFRLASWAHALPRSAGCYLLFDVTQPVESASDLIPFVSRLPALQQGHWPPTCCSGRKVLIGSRHTQASR